MSEVHLEQGMSPAEPAGAASVGAVLRRTREARGETLSDVAYALKLTPRQVEAMEAERFDLLPGPAFVRGFLRNYARYLGIDPVALLADFDRDNAAPAVELAPLSNADGVMPSGGAARSAQLPAALVAGGLLLAVLAGWFFDWFRMPEADPTVSEPVAPAAEVLQAEPTSPAPPAASAARDAVPAIILPAPVPVPVPVPVPGPAPQVAPAPAPSIPPATPAAAAAPAVAPSPASPTGVEHLVFRFAGESWIEVRDAGGAIIYSGVNARGSSRTVQGKPPFALVVGNAREVALEYRGQTLDLVPHIRVSVARLTVQ